MKTFPQKILIVKPSSLGDIVHALPAVRLIVRENPQIQIDWVVRPAFAPLLDYFPNIGRKILFRRREMGNWKTFLPVFGAFLQDLRREKYDAVLDMQGLLRSAIFSFCARSKVNFGPACSREFGMGLFYRRKIALPENLFHAVDRNVALVRAAFGIEKQEAAFSPMESNGKYAAVASQLLRENGISPDDALFGIIPGANWASKCWPPEFFAAVIDELGQARPDWKFLIFGTEKEAGIVRQIQKQCRLPENRLLPFAGKTGLGELAEILRRMRGVCGGDTGTMHLAAALGVPTVALYGSTRPELTGIRAPRSIILQPEISCLGCLQRICPYPENRCHSGITPEKVASAAAGLCDGARS